MKLLPLKLSEEELQVIHDLAAVNYSPEKIAIYLDLDKAAVLAEFYNKLSDFRTAYDRGMLEAEFLINQKQGELAKSGNITAAQVFLKENERIRNENLLKNILFGHDY